MTDAERRTLIAEALQHLRHARALLRNASCPRAALYVARSMKSAEGAQRHAVNVAMRHEENR